ncbi:prolipoprotein diacylglyceryl transferase [Sporosalibacterium faouarense]|jgi:phosphatidylglycerol:prolipoprotein diacylglycerol transferase|uniref:prolipoprotein diacylglyceryl transferase n=1 Tax=Sporosalibacterium faouarense TaxID=516123 RepID=UPI00192B8372|nr:prolipoprotein diacylglyceryl transferase [Sporosalibacterium faouarense]
MNRVAFEIFGLEILWYGIIISFAMVIGTILALREARKKNISEDDILNIILLVIPSSIVGARLYYVIFEWQSYKDNIISILNIREGGLAIHGGVIAGLIAGFIYVKKKKLMFFKLGDIFAPSLILGQAIGRWGNFFNQEAHGGPVSEQFISIFPEFIKNNMYIQGQYYHPAFLYESIWNFLAFIFLIIYKDKKKFDGEILLLYGILYSIGRFFIEGMRTDSLMLGPIRIAQLMSLLIITICVAIYFYNKKKIPR